MNENEIAQGNAKGVGHAAQNVNVQQPPVQQAQPQVQQVPVVDAPIFNEPVINEPEIVNERVDEPHVEGCEYEKVVHISDSEQIESDDNDSDNDDPDAKKIRKKFEKETITVSIPSKRVKMQVRRKTNGPPLESSSKKRKTLDDTEKVYNPTDELVDADVLQAMKVKAEAGRKKPTTKNPIILQTLSSVATSIATTTTTIPSSGVSVTTAVDLLHAIFAEATTTKSVSTPSRSIPPLIPETAKFMDSIFDTPSSTIPPQASTSGASDAKDEQIFKLRATVDDLSAQVADLNAIVNSQLDLLNDLANTNMLQRLDAQGESSRKCKEDKSTMFTGDDEDNDLDNTSVDDWLSDEEVKEIEFETATKEIKYKTFEGVEISSKIFEEKDNVLADDWLSDEEVDEIEFETDSEEIKYISSEGVEFSSKFFYEIGQVDEANNEPNKSKVDCLQTGKKTQDIFGDVVRGSLLMHILDDKSLKIV
ncbi:hypothetical protein L1987_64274 [Smallanthus sonchifolius]|uniref:Uncharacterized protein n=1 Tax=Smallanthus sonchifolius TaxID=185202 RepID=A0ACB9CFK6_9ASTR|nr:hypothetical protein L1987_64274 [Smallanthus sonchifolius]